MFIKLTGRHMPGRANPQAAETTIYVNHTWIEEVFAGPTVYKVDDEKNPVVDEHGNKVVDYHTTYLYTAGADNAGSGESRFEVRVDLDTVMARISAALEAGKACCDVSADDEDDDAPQLNDRGVWLPGESYVQLDVVKHPEDVSKKFIALQPSKSTSVLVLANTGYWCKLG
ncbi:MAG: hypothetical protein F4Z29_01240 [Gemmatimonadetes bacterium]|nr:hypothetical protein [Gemmatimonadota bacterium]